MSQESSRPQRSSQDASLDSTDSQADLRKVRSQPVPMPPAPLPPDPQQYQQYQQSRNRAPSSAMPETSYTQPVRDAVSSAVNSGQAPSTDPAFIARITEEVLRSLNMQPVNGQPTARTLSPQPIPSRAPPTSPNATVPPQNIHIPPPSPSGYASSNVDGMSDIPESQLDGRSERQATSGYGEGPESPPRKDSQFVGSDDGKGRPRVSVRKSAEDATTLEKIWQPLFDPTGRPTERLGQFLRGLAIHIINDYEPKQSIVITPPKMLRFYEEVKLPEEMFPWNTIFGGRVTNSSLSHLYRDLKCQHHFVQNYYHEKPQTPALTPLGFECWMTHFIRSYPDMEFERFTKAVLHMPISNADNPRERFPKELSRRLFPRIADDIIRLDLEDAMVADEVIQLNRIVSAPPTTDAPTQSAPMQMPTGPNFPPPTSTDNDVQAFSTSPSEFAVEDGNSSNVRIERERQPYYAAPGGGRQYDDGKSPKPDNTLPPRSNTTSTGTRPNLDVSDDYVARASQHRRTGSQAASAAPPSSMRNNRRQRSPSMNGRQHNPFTRSEGDVNAGGFGNGGSSAYGPDEDEQYRHGREDRTRRYVPDEQRYYPPPPPPPQQPRQQYDDEYYRRATISGSYPTGYGPPPPQPGQFRQGQ